MTSKTVFATGDILEVGPGDVEKMKKLAMETPSGKSRLCLHHSPDALLHEMVNACRADAYVRPHRHPEGKSESYHMIEGEMTVYLFDDTGRVVRRFAMGVPGCGETFLYRLSASKWHMVVPESSVAVYHETFQGPHDKEADVEYAPWSPSGSDWDEVDAFLKRLKDA